jgi:hypothetical protein
MSGNTPGAVQLNCSTLERSLIMVELATFIAAGSIAATFFRAL